jgi:tetratricopeptide (TPR) repeat protein
MKLKFALRLYLLAAVVLQATPIFAEDTNGAASATNGAAAVTRDEMANNYLQIQEQLHATQIAIEQNQEVAMETGQSNALVLAERLQALEQMVARQRASDADSARKTQQLTMLMAGSFGLMGLGIMLLMVYFQWRAFTQLAQISGRQSAMMANGDAVHQLAAPGRATVEASTSQLLDVVGRLERRINELENGQKLLPEIASAKPADLLTEGQKYLDANLPLKALECFDQVLAGQPARADAMVKRAMALEKLGRDDDALAGYNRAITMDSSLVIAHLHKGGLLNRLRRYDEALNCYEQALVGQDKKARVN